MVDRIMAKVTRDVNGCWIFTGTLDKDGYGRIVVPGMGTRLSHRLMYEAKVGPIPKGLEIDHLCRIRSCVKPEHLEAVTRRENSLRSESFAAINARKTHCIHGHEFTPENTYVKPNGHRQCRRCNSEQMARYYNRRGKGVRDARRARLRKDKPDSA